MPEIRFYHLTRRTAEQALPELLNRALSKGYRLVVRSRDEADSERLNEHLWTYDPDSFLAHGSARDGKADRQPVFLVHGNDNPSGADVLMLMPGAVTDAIEPYALCCVLLNGQDDAQVAEARGLWKVWKEAGHTITYWQQGEDGKWAQKA